MKEKKDKNFLKVTYDLLATTKLSSTQKLFISYIIGWQKNGKICTETNNNLAMKFGMKYSGMRSVITELNKLDFFKSVQKDYDEKTTTSGHEITVDVDKLDVFLASETSIKKTDSTEDVENQFILNDEKIIPDIQNDNSNEEIGDCNIKAYTSELIVNRVLNNDNSSIKYQLDEKVNIREILTQLGFNTVDDVDDVMDFIDKVDSFSMCFKDFIAMAKKLYKEKRYGDYEGIIITDEVLTKINQMIQV